MKFGKCMGTLEVIRGRLYDVLEVYGDPRGWGPWGVMGGHYTRF